MRESSKEKRRVERGKEGKLCIRVLEKIESHRQIMWIATISQIHWHPFNFWMNFIKYLNL